MNALEARCGTPVRSGGSPVRSDMRSWLVLPISARWQCDWTKLWSRPSADTPGTSVIESSRFFSSIRTGRKGSKRRERHFLRRNCQFLVRWVVSMCQYYQQVIKAWNFSMYSTLQGKGGIFAWHGTMLTLLLLFSAVFSLRSPSAGTLGWMYIESKFNLANAILNVCCFILCTCLGRDRECRVS